MFIGEYHHSIDDKGRVAVPVKFREQLRKGSVVTKGLDTCLVLYPIEEWEQLASKLSKLPISQSNTRAFSRFVLSGAMDVDLDKQGRVVVPDYLREFAHLQKKAVIVGLYNRVEIWDEEQWQTYRQKTEKESIQIAEKLGEMDI
jgi:MraZ protein